MRREKKEKTKKSQVLLYLLYHELGHAEFECMGFGHTGCVDMRYAGTIRRLEDSIVEEINSRDIPKMDALIASAKQILLDVEELKKKNEFEVVG